MPKFDVDIKAFLSVHVEADTQEAAEAEAKAFVEGLSPSEFYVQGWNVERCGGPQISCTGLFDCEDAPYTEEMADAD